MGAEGVVLMDAQRKPEGLEPEGDEDDGGAHADCREQVEQRQPPAAEDDPQPDPHLQLWVLYRFVQGLVRRGWKWEDLPRKRLVAQG